jgi:mRNA-degrading endonuclease YafQ of YafQ-DinJ toxin-antitoxin module
MTNQVHSTTFSIPCSLHSTYMLKLVSIHKKTALKTCKSVINPLRNKSQLATFAADNRYALKHAWISANYTALRQCLVGPDWYLLLIINLIKTCLTIYKPIQWEIQKASRHKCVEFMEVCNPLPCSWRVTVPLLRN